MSWNWRRGLKKDSSAVLHAWHSHVIKRMNSLCISFSLYISFSLRDPDHSHWRHIEVRKLCAVPTAGTYSCAQTEKIGRVSALPGINLSGVVASSVSPEGRFVRAAIRCSIKLNSTARSIYSLNGCVRLSSRQYRDSQMEIESQTALSVFSFMMRMTLAVYISF